MSKPKPSTRNAGTPKEKLKPTESRWGEAPQDNFGYASEEERLAKRGLEDWELVDRIPESQRNIPPWFTAVIVVVLLVAVGLSFPFWGNRVGYERTWFDWGFVGAIVYVILGATFVYFMTRMYGSKMAGRLDSDKETTSAEGDKSAGTEKRG